MSTQVAAATAVADPAAGESATPADAEPPVEAPAPADGVARRVDQPWRRAGLMGLSTWAAAVIVYVLVTATSWMIDDRQGPPLHRLFEAWDHWDTGHYIRISQLGYTPDRPDTHAFFPFFPLLLRGVDTILPGPALVASLVASNVACIGALVVLHRFATHEFDAVVADRVLLFLMAWPTAFFLSAGYNGSLFLLLSAAALYSMRTGRWWIAGGLGALASGTRLSGVLLAVAFLLEYGRQHRWRPRDLRPDLAAVLLIPLGLVAFSVYCWLTLGDPLAFSHAQAQWGRRFEAPWIGIMEALDTVDANPVLLQVALHNLLDVVAALGTIALLLACAVGPWRLRRDQFPLVAYAAASYLVVLVGPVGGLFPVQGAARYALELIPIFFLLARAGASRHFERLYLLPAIGLQVVFLLTFINNVWVA